MLSRFLSKETLVNKNSSSAGSSPELIERAKQGDSDAFAAIFHGHKARVYSLCLGMTNNTAEAEDLTQNAFMQVFRKLATFRGDSAFSTWLYRVAFNTVLMHFRRKLPREFSLDEPVSNGKDDKPVRREYGTEDLSLEGAVDRIALSRAIRELPEGYRTVFLLHEVEGFEHQEIAELLGCSTGNSKSQLHKAKLKIRELLGYSQREQAVTVKRAEGDHTPARLSLLPKQWKASLLRAGRSSRTRAAAPALPQLAESSG